MDSSVVPLPDGIFSMLDTDLYKLTMQSAVLKHFPDIKVTYSYTNRTPELKLSRIAFNWLQAQIQRLANIRLVQEELAYLKKACPYLSGEYLHYLQSFRFRPSEHIRARFKPDDDSGKDAGLGKVELDVEGLWVETILYEIPLLALTSEAYFKFCDLDWSHDGQVEQAKEKGLRLMEAGCLAAEYGSRRRRDYKTHEMVMQGLKQALEEGAARGYKGKITGTSNVHLAMRFGIPPMGTVAHEWFMGIAAVRESYQYATEAALSYWIDTFGKGVLGIALTDTFGTPIFLKAFARPIQALPTSKQDSAVSLPTPATGFRETERRDLSSGASAVSASNNSNSNVNGERPETYADVFIGVRQDSGDPREFVKVMHDFYGQNPVKSKKTIVFSDSLNIDRCIEYKAAAEEAGFTPSFGIGTFFTNDFKQTSTGKKSVPLNIVIKLSSADGKPAVKISDNLGKNTGDSATVAEVKHELGYTEREWKEGDERTRWGT